MKNFKITSVFCAIALLAATNYSVVAKSYVSDFSIYSNTNNFCIGCLASEDTECKTSNTHIQEVAFSTLYKYNSNKFTTCDFNAEDSKFNIENKIAEKIDFLQLHENHIHEITYKIKKHHMNMINSNTDASFKYVVLPDPRDNYHKEVIDYGIKLKLK